MDDQQIDYRKNKILSYVFFLYILKWQATENNQNNNSNEKRKRDGTAAGCKIRDEFDQKLERGVKERKRLR
jgi:hypothetical protein